MPKQIMNTSLLGRFILLAALCTSSMVQATTVEFMSLEKLTTNAARVFRGTVTAVEPGEVFLAGGKLPTITVTINVNERLKGSFPDHDIVELTMVGDMKSERASTPPQRGFLNINQPTLKIGQSYVLFTTPPSSAGLSTTVGLGQGAFSVVPSGQSEVVINEVENRGLFDGPISYSDFRQLIQQELNR